MTDQGDPGWAGGLSDEADGSPTSDGGSEPSWAKGLMAEADHAPSHQSAPNQHGTSHQPSVIKTSAPTSYQKSTAPDNSPEMSWGDVARSAVQNAPQSAKDAGAGIWNAVTHPMETLGNLGKLGVGAGSQIAGMAGVKQDAGKKASDEALINALENHYKQTYGSVKGFKKAVATDPVSIAMDASTVIPFVGEGAGALGATKTAGVLGKLGSAIDPVANAVRVAKAPVTGIALGSKRIPGLADVARQASSITTGVPESAMKLATQVGAHPDPAVRAAYKRFVTGQGDATEFQQAARTAVNSIKQDMSNNYLAQKGPMAQMNVPLSNTYDALNAAEKKAQLGSRTGQVPQKAMQAISEARAMADDVSNNPGRSTLENVDALKQQMWDLKSLHPDLADNYLNGIYHGVRDDLVNADPKYAALMSTYQAGLQNVNDLTKTLIGGKNAAASATLTKNLRALKTGTGENLLQQMMEKDPTIGGMLAGSALHPWHAGGRSAVEALMAVPAAGAIFSHPAAAAAAIPTSLAASSPRLAGAVNYGAGQLSRIASNPSLRNAKLGAYAASKIDAPTDIGAPQLASNPTDSDVDALTRMVIAEAGNQSDEGKAAVTHVALNRAKLSGQSLSDVIHHPWAFEGVQNGNAAKIDPNSALYKKVRDEIVVPALNGSDDNTHGATHFINKDVQTKLGRKIPAWAQGDGQQIGDHTFYSGDFAVGGRAGFKTGGAAKKDVDIEPLVDRLMKLAKSAKKTENARTEPMLSLPDHAVIKALDIAQRGI